MTSRAPGWRTPLLAGVLGFLVAAAMAILARGLAGDEEAFHFLVSRYAPAHPELFLGVAERPLVTLLLAVPAQGGLLAARLMSALATGLACVGVARAARASGLGSPWLGASLLLVQPFFLAHAGTAMTEPWAAALVAWGLVAWIERRWTLLIVCSALLPLARLELVALVLPVLGLALRERRWRVPVLVSAPLVAWGLLSVMSGSDPGALWNPSQWPSYPARDYLHYLRAFSWITGAALAPLVILGMAGAVAPRWFQIGGSGGAALRASMVLIGIALTVYTLFASVWAVTFGNLRYFGSLGPAFALTALGGLDLLKRAPRVPVFLALGLSLLAAVTLWGNPWFRDFSPLERTNPLPAVITGVWILIALLPLNLKRIAPLLALGLGASLLAREYAATLHLQPSPEHAAMRELAAILPEEAAEQAPLLSAHPLLALELGLDPYDPQRFPGVDDTTLALAPPSTILVWDSHYLAGLSPTLDSRNLAGRRDWSYHAGVASSDSAFAAAFFLRPRAEDEGAVATFTLAPLPAPAWMAAARLAHSGAVREEQMARADTRSPLRWRRAAEAFLRADRPDRARPALDRARDLAPEDPANDLLAANLARREGNSEAALRAARQATARAPDSGEAEFLVGAILSETGRTTEARGHLLRAAAMLPRRWDVQYVAARILSLEGNWDEARRHFDAALRLAPPTSEAPFRAAEAAVTQGAPEDAERWLRRAIESNSREARLHLMLTTLLADLGRHEEALLAVEQGLLATGGDPRLLSLRGALSR